MRDVTPKTMLAKPITHQVAGNLALDFCNTCGEHLAERPDEMLLDWERFVRWATQVGLIETGSYAELLRHPAPMSKVVQLREAIYRVGLAVARGERVPASDMDAIRLQANAAKPAVANTAAGMRWRPDALKASGQLRALLASDALLLFCSPRAARIGICDGAMCGWLFVDESRGKRRRWVRYEGLRQPG